MKLKDKTYIGVLTAGAPLTLATGTVRRTMCTPFLMAEELMEYTAPLQMIEEPLSEPNKRSLFSEGIICFE